MNRLVLVVTNRATEPGEGDETYFLPVTTFLCRSGLEASLIEAAEEARLTGYWCAPFGVPGTKLKFTCQTLLDDDRVAPPKILTVDEWFEEYGRG